MATIAITSISSQKGRFTAAKTVLGASDTFTYNANTGQVLVLNNVTGGALTPKIDGAGGTTKYVKGVGTVDVSAGYTFASIPAGAQVAIKLDDIAAYLQGVIAVTGGTGIEATLLQFV